MGTAKPNGRPVTSPSRYEVEGRGIEARPLPVSYCEGRRTQALVAFGRQSTALGAGTFHLGRASAKRRLSNAAAPRHLRTRTPALPLSLGSRPLVLNWESTAQMRGGRHHGFPADGPDSPSICRVCMRIESRKFIISSDGHRSSVPQWPTRERIAERIPPSPPFFPVSMGGLRSRGHAP